MTTKPAGFFFAFALLAVSGLARGANASVIKGPLFNPATRHAYVQLSAANWVASEEEAIALGGHLATINDAAENDWVATRFVAADRNIWIGLNDQLVEGSYVWASGESSAYRNWAPSQPDNRIANVGPGGQDFVRIYNVVNAANANYHRWDDLSESSELFGVPLSGVVEINVRPGDANVDGRVDFADLVLLAQHYNSGAGVSYGEGDFDWDGGVGFSDLVILAQNYNSGASSLIGFAPDVAADWAFAQSLVPEPVAGSALAAIALVQRRRGAAHSPGATTSIRRSRVTPRQRYTASEYASGASPTHW